MIAHTAYPAIDNRSVLIRAKSGAEMEIDCTPEQYLAGLEAYKNGALMQDAFHFLTASQREFLISGLNQDEWERMFGKDDE
jgi:hypothetical protein